VVKILVLIHSFVYNALIYKAGFKKYFNMGETTDQFHLILDKPPKKLEYILKLKDYEETNLYLQAKNFLTSNRKTQAYTVSKWCEILDSTKTNPTARSFLETLIEEDVLVENGTNPNGDEQYSLDKKELLGCYQKSFFYQLTRDLNIETINQEERFKSVVTDVSLY